MTPTSFGYQTIDPSANRIIEETAAVLHDVDVRIAQLKMGLSQVAPHLAPILLSREIGIQRNVGAYPGVGQPWSQPLWLNANPLVHGLQHPMPFGFQAPFLGVGNPNLGMIGQSLPFVGVTNPVVGFGHPFRGL